MRAAWLILTLFAIPALAGCLQDDDRIEPTPTTTPPRQPKQGVHLQTFGNGTSLDNMTVHNALVDSEGTYYSTGYSTFEPTIGATSTGEVFTINFRGLGAGTRIIRTSDQGQTWEDVTPVLPTGMKAVPNSNDPFIYVDPFTDRVYDFDMCLILSGFCVSYSDDLGETWTTYSVAAGAALDHQSMAAAPPTGDIPMDGYESVLVYCVNRGLTTTGPWCSSSGDGGRVWTPQVPGYPTGTPQCSGLHGHVAGSAEGFFYRGNPSCSGPAVYRSMDGGLSWTEHVITGDEVGTQGHEIQVAADAAGGVYAFWIGDDERPYLAVSRDRGDTWSTPHQVGPADLESAGFPAIEAGAPGHIAFTFIATTESSEGWNGYIGVSVDALADSPSVASVRVNAVEDPLDDSNNCGQTRCGGFGDFVDITIDGEGRPWAALAHNDHQNAGIVATLMTGPSLWGNGTLSPIPAGGASEWG